MVFKVWTDDDDWKDLGEHHVPKSFVAATCVFVVLGKGPETPGGLAELRKILSSISGGADEIGKKANEPLFEINDDKVFWLYDRIQKDKKLLERWSEHVKKGTHTRAGGHFARKIINNNRSPYKINQSKDKFELTPNNTRTKVLEDFANEWYGRVRAKWFIVASAEEINAEAALLKDSS